MGSKDLAGFHERLARRMAVGDFLLGVLDHGGSEILVAGFTYTVVRAASSRHESTDTDRVVADLNEDLRRWVRDRERELVIEHTVIVARYNDPDSVPEWRERVPEQLRHLPAGSQYYSGAHVVAHADAQRRALHEYRAEASRKLRAFEAQIENETRMHGVWRRRHKRSQPRLSLTQDCRDILQKWRRPASVPGMDHEVPIDDPTRLELEPGLAKLEADPSLPESGSSETVS